jgi:hypothetical protein
MFHTMGSGWRKLASEILLSHPNALLRSLRVAQFLPLATDILSLLKLALRCAHVVP